MAQLKRGHYHFLFHGSQTCFCVAGSVADDASELSLLLYTRDESAEVHPILEIKRQRSFESKKHKKNT